MNLVIEIKLLVDTTRAFRGWLQLALYTCGNILRQQVFDVVAGELVYPTSEATKML